MAVYSREKLSGSTNGRAIKVAATATAGTLLHTAIAGTSSWDEVYAWVTNTSGSAATLTIEWGGVTDPDDLIVKALSIPANSPPIQIVPGVILQNGLAVRAFAGTANVLLITGYVNRISG
jgi:hypothetical protein